MEASQRHLCQTQLEAAPAGMSQREMSPLLSMDGKAQGSGRSDPEDWPFQIPLENLPPLPGRACGYRTEPMGGTIVICGITALLVSSAWTSEMDVGTLSTVRALMVLWASTALLCLAYILLATPNEIPRNESTCYPIPREVLHRLRNKNPLEDLTTNIVGSDGSSIYCVRCLVWRTEAMRRQTGAPSHHCQTCQRCVTGFDHHCGVLGRCIVSRNMPCFLMLIGMLIAGILTMVISRAMSERSHGRPDGFLS